MDKKKRNIITVVTCGVLGILVFFGFVLATGTMSDVGGHRAALDENDYAMVGFGSSYGMSEWSVWASVDGAPRDIILYVVEDYNYADDIVDYINGEISSISYVGFSQGSSSAQVEQITVTSPKRLYAVVLASDGNTWTAGGANVTIDIIHQVSLGLYLAAPAWTTMIGGGLCIAAVIALAKSSTSTKVKPPEPAKVRAPPAPPVGKKVCPTCGRAIPAEQVFCGECGAKQE